MNSAIVLPSYNEKENIVGLISTIMDLDKSFTVIVVDDNSPDKTYEVVSNFKNNLSDEDSERVQMIKRQKKDGRGGAVWEGMRMAYESGHAFENFIEMDCDFSHDPCYIKNGIKLLQEGNNLVLGSRYPDGKIINWTIKRRIISFFANILARVLIDWRIHDFTNGFRFYNRELIKYILTQEMKHSGYINLTETISMTLKVRKSIASFPIIFKNRKLGKSNTDIKELFNSFLGIFSIAWHHRFK